MSVGTIGPVDNGPLETFPLRLLEFIEKNRFTVKLGLRMLNIDLDVDELVQMIDKVRNNPAAMDKLRRITAPFGGVF